MTYNDGEEHEVQRLIIHPDFRKRVKIAENDIGLIELAKPIKFSKVQKPIPLTKPILSIVPGKNLTISGYGREEEHQQIDVLQLKATYLSVVDLGNCQQDYYMDPISDKMVCVGNSIDSPCIGDNGDPGVMDGRLVAIVSNQLFCNTDSIPAVFTAVYKYLDWIYGYINV